MISSQIGVTPAKAQIAVQLVMNHIKVRPGLIESARRSDGRPGLERVMKFDRDHTSVTDRR